MAVKDFGVKGILPLSMLDWEGRLVSTIFLSGCNLRCPFCHNPSLVLEDKDLPVVTSEEIQHVLIEKRGWVDGVCITGGEPTINNGIFDLLEFIKSLGYQVKLDTNATRPNVLAELINSSLVSAIAVDIKTSFHKYSYVTQRPDLSDRVKKSIGLLIEAESKDKVEVEFRTTVVPTFVEKDDVLRIAKYLKEAGARRYYLQQFNPKTVMVPAISSIRPFDKEFLSDLAAESSKIVPTYLRN
ncbi:MAG: anaerobic ribonucleoside-triphosphate reductase activating protein [Actinomycetota bacterium]|nr:anaerobic ribonucleoside-triphosphate reductase activating protein [Actinomycetota bacterium]